jgi:hypothetical protein
MYQHVANGVTFPKLWSMLKDCFGSTVVLGRLTGPSLLRWQAMRAL